MQRLTQTAAALAAGCGACCCCLLLQLDAGVSEQVLLQSRDERSLLVVSYADIKVRQASCLQPCMVQQCSSCFS
jgi:hypothetical protein